jgi:ABC-2 type transport system permease protein
MRRLKALMRKEFTHMRRDPRTLMFIFVMPVLQLLLLGYATNTDIKNVPTIVFDQDNSKSSRSLLDAYEVTGYFNYKYLTYSENEVYQAIDAGRAKIGIIIPPGYGHDLASGKQAQVAVLIDGSDSTIANTVMSSAVLVGQSQATIIKAQQLSNRGYIASATLPLDVRTNVLYNPDMQSSYNLIPGLIAMILMMTTTNLTSLSIVKERERGTIEQLIVTPIRSWELVIAKITPYILVSMGDTILVLIIGTIWFGVPIRGSLLLLLALTALYMLPNLGIGLLISTFAKTQQEAQFMTMPIMLPSMMLSGFIFPTAALPLILRIVGDLLPLTYFIFILRTIVVKGAGIGAFLPQIGALAVLAIVLLTLAALRFHKTLD